MKIRTDFVTNSSSVCYVVLGRYDLSDSFDGGLIHGFLLHPARITG